MGGAHASTKRAARGTGRGAEAKAAEREEGEGGSPLQRKVMFRPVHRHPYIQHRREGSAGGHIRSTFVSMASKAEK
jgi:hypothetical protein